MGKYYAVKVGRVPGVYTTWAECEAQVSGFPKAAYKSFPTREAAEKFIDVSGDDFTPDHIINTDGGCIGNGTTSSRGGIGVTIEGPRLKLELSLPLRLPESVVPTNQLAELTAVITALERVIDSGVTGCNFLLRTDSHYTIQCLTSWWQGWVANGWRTQNGPVKNKDVIEYALGLIDMVRMDNKLKFEHVYGHAGDPGNERVDKLATLALQ